MGDSWNINWYVDATAKVLDSPQYSSFANTAISTIDANAVKAALGACMASRESAEVCAYLAGILRLQALLA